MMFVLRLVMIWFRHWLWLMVRHWLRLLIRHGFRDMVRERFSLDKVRVCRCCPPVLQLSLHIYQL
jgi:hypothetical protein